MTLTIYRFLSRYHIIFLRLAMAIIYVWFGILKPFNLSPANELVTETIPFIPAHTFIWILGVWEVAIGVLFLFRRFTSIAIILFLLHIPGTFLPFLVVPHRVFVAPFVLTLEGQYIIKNLALIGLVLTIGLDYYRSRFETIEK
jgi:uncharacterized membrane protein YphA (DoxX/SURF4 family)